MLFLEAKLEETCSVFRFREWRFCGVAFPAAGVLLGTLQDSRGLALGRRDSFFAALLRWPPTCPWLDTLSHVASFHHNFKEGNVILGKIYEDAKL